MELTVGGISQTETIAARGKPRCFFTSSEVIDELDRESQSELEDGSGSVDENSQNSENSSNH